ncbi:hypothetical protein Q75_00815 [Bacillus coahuilensis p1.1.43]|uniref:Uncharacterized protein n=2 Tax=Bacillus coahuilensis TaxID=408580 RepID=A0A147KCB1_9BACI|nr:hypothetical protein Q75_00815 [Bacillus coahuilensis p1.1.43]
MDLKIDFTTDLLNQIYEKALEEEMLENKKIPSNEDCKVDHFSSYHVTIVADNHTFEHQWSNNTCTVNKDTIQLKRFVDFVAEIGTGN